MKVVALISGGKDSCYNMQLCELYGHEIVALANLRPAHDGIDELDSFMYQTVGHQVVEAFAHCMGLPLFRRRIRGSPREKGLRYSATKGDEVEDLEVLLTAVKQSLPGVGGVSTGAIASDYQRLRVENVCSRLGLISLAFMWKQEQALLLQNMVDSGLQAVFVKVAAMGLDPQKHLGKDLGTLQPLLLKLQSLYGCNVCGEGGEYETLTLDCRLFKNARIVLDKFTVELHSPGTIAPVGVLHPVQFHLETKSSGDDLSMTKALVHEVDSDSNCQQENMRLSLPEIAHGPYNRTSYVPSQGHSLACEILTGANRRRHGYVAIGSWWQNSVPLGDVQEELHYLLTGIEISLQKEKLSWADVLYVHLYLNNMTDFSKANEIYAQHITEKDHVRGVPSRCCVELPLEQAEMGRVAVEILAATEPTKQVLHVQSMSSWAPCCIGPYSQATQHQRLIYMAGQLGFDPPTMTLVPGGATCEMVEALRNCVAVGESFTPTFLPSVLSFTVYCSSAIGADGAALVETGLEKYLQESDTKRLTDHLVPKPLILYISIPALPRSALVEVAPLTYASASSYDTYLRAADEKHAVSWRRMSQHSHSLGLPADQMRSTCEGLVLPGYLCRAFVFLSSYKRGADELAVHSVLNVAIALKQAVELVLTVLQEADLTALDVFTFRLYFVAKKICGKDLSRALEDCIPENIPRPMLIPVLGVGSTAEMQGLIAMEFTASSGRSEDLR